MSFLKNIIKPVIPSKFWNDLRKKQILSKHKKVADFWNPIIRFTLCAGEFFIATELTNSFFKFKIFYCDRLLKCDFGKVSSPRIYRTEDYEGLINSGCLFARKFSSEDLTVVDKIMKHI